jgi:hypothetical protein
MQARLGHLWSARATHAAMPAPARPTSVPQDAHCSDRTSVVCPRWLPLWPTGEARAARITRHQC